MKKILTTVFMMVLLCLMGALSFRSLGDHALEVQEQAREEQESFHENPAPPDLVSLERMGIRPFVSELPVIMLDTGGQSLRGEEFISAKAAIFDGIGNDIQGSPNLVLNGNLRLRGSNPERREKKQYRLNLLKDNLKSPLNYGLFGMEPDNSWVLAGPYLDASLVRNALAYGLAGDMLHWAPDSRFCEVFVDGEYQGVYLAVEAVTPDKNRLNLSKFGLLSGSCPYIAQREAPNQGDIAIRTEGSPVVDDPLVIKYPDQPTRRQLQWIRQDLEEFERVLYSDRFADPRYGYARYLDTGDFIDALILNELAMNPKLSGGSSYYYRNLEGRLCLTVWDFNRSFNNGKFSLPVDQWIASQGGWFQRLVQDRGFVERMENRYLELRRGILSEEAIFKRIDEMDRQLGDAARRNALRWGEEGQDSDSRLQAVETLKSTITRRLAFMDQGFPLLYEGCIN